MFSWFRNLIKAYKMVFAHSFTLLGGIEGQTDHKLFLRNSLFVTKYNALSNVLMTHGSCKGISNDLWPSNKEYGSVVGQLNRGLGGKGAWEGERAWDGAGA